VISYNPDTLCEKCGRFYDSFKDFHCPCEMERIKKEDEERQQRWKQEYEQQEAERKKQVSLLNSVLSMAERSQGNEG